MAAGQTGRDRSTSFMSLSLVMMDLSAASLESMPQDSQEQRDWHTFITLLLGF